MMPTVLEGATHVALREFYQFVEEQQAELRDQLSAAGSTPAQIERQIAAQRPGLAVGQEAIRRLVERDLRNVCNLADAELDERSWDEAIIGMYRDALAAIPGAN